MRIAHHARNCRRSTSIAKLRWHFRRKLVARSISNFVPAVDAPPNEHSRLAISLIRCAARHFACRMPMLVTFSISVRCVKCSARSAGRTPRSRASESRRTRVPFRRLMFVRRSSPRYSMRASRMRLWLKAARLSTRASLKMHDSAGTTSCVVSSRKAFLCRRKWLFSNLRAMGRIIDLRRYILRAASTMTSRRDSMQAAHSLVVRL